MRSALVLGSSGGTGRELVRCLRERGIDVVAASRSMGRVRSLCDRTGATERVVDPTDADSVIRAAEGIDVVFNCSGPTGGEVEMLGAVADAVSRAINKTGIRAVHLSSAWPFSPVRGSRLAEDHPRIGGPDFLDWRRRSDEALLDAGATVVHLPDFFGPGVRISPLQFALRHARTATSFAWIAGADVEREYLYVPDGMRLAADLADVEAAVGDRFIAPGSGPISIRSLARIIEPATGKPLRYVEPGCQTRDEDVDRRLVDEVGLMADEYARPISYDASRCLRLVPHHAPTPYSEAISETLRLESMQ
jgi:nucleoside-diphosphate-sugar epimerase